MVALKFMRDEQPWVRVSIIYQQEGSLIPAYGVVQIYLRRNVHKNMMQLPLQEVHRLSTFYSHTKEESRYCVGTWNCYCIPHFDRTAGHVWFHVLNYELAVVEAFYDRSTTSVKTCSDPPRPSYLTPTRRRRYSTVVLHVVVISVNIDGARPMSILHQ